MILNISQTCAEEERVQEPQDRASSFTVVSGAFFQLHTSPFSCGILARCVVFLIMKLHRKFSKPFFTNCYFETRGRKFQFDSRKLLYRLSYVKLLSFNSQTYKGVFEVLARRKIGGASTKGSRSCNQNTKRYMSI